MISEVKTKKELAEGEYKQLDAIHKNITANNTTILKVSYANMLLYVLKTHFPTEVQDIEYLKYKTIPITQKRKMIDIINKNKDAVLEKTLEMKVDKMREISIIKTEFDELHAEQDKVDKIFSHEKDKIKEFFDYIADKTNIYLIIREYMQYINLFIKYDNTEDKSDKNELWKILCKKKTYIHGSFYHTKILDAIFPEVAQGSRDEKNERFPRLNIYEVIDQNDIVEKQEVLKEKLEQYKTDIEEKEITVTYNNTDISNYSRTLFKKYKENTLELINKKNLGEDSKKLVKVVLNKIIIYKLEEIDQ